MIFILICIFLALDMLYLYFYKNIKLASVGNQIIEELHTETLPELVKGQVGFVMNGHIKICYELISCDKPNAEYIVLLHGLTRTMLTYSNDFMQAFLDAGYNIVRMDNRDSGLSTWVTNWENGHKYTLEDMAEDTMAVMNYLQIEQFHLAGKSMGGMIGQCIAIQYPERVKTLISMMSTGFFHDTDLVQVPRKFTFNFVLSYLAYFRRSKKIDSQLKFYLAVEHLLAGNNKKAIDEKSVLQRALYVLKHRNGFNKRARKQHGYAIKKSGSRLDALKQLSTPTLVIHGKADPLVQFEHGKKSAATIPNAQHLFLDEMGHRIPQIYSTIITKSILQFLDAHKLNVKRKDQLPLESS